MKRFGMFSVALGAMLFAGNVLAVEVTIGTIEVKNKTDDSIWVTFNAISSDCPGGCSYVRIASGNSKSPLSSLTGSKINVYARDTKGKELVEKGVKIKKNKVEIYVEGGKIKFVEVDA